MSDFGQTEFKSLELPQERCVARQLEYCLGVHENGEREWGRGGAKGHE